jgi:hypothetical protein
MSKDPYLDGIMKVGDEKKKLKIKKCDNPDCETSTGICGSFTHGTGKLDPNGYWEFPCELDHSDPVLPELKTYYAVWWYSTPIARVGKSSVNARSPKEALETVLSDADFNDDIRKNGNVFIFNEPPALIHNHHR